MNHDHTDHRAIPPAGSDPYDRFAADPFAPTTPAPPVGQPAPTAQPVRHRWWMHLLMCAPMLLVVAGYLWAGRASLAAGGVLAALVPAIGCMLMMWLMMRMMDHGSQH